MNDATLPDDPREACRAVHGAAGLILDAPPETGASPIDAVADFAAVADAIMADGAGDHRAFDALRRAGDA